MQSGSGQLLCRSCAIRNKQASSLPFVLEEEAAGILWQAQARCLCSVSSKSICSGTRERSVACCLDPA